MNTTVDWRQQARCRHEDPDLFFPIGGAGPSLSQIRQAKSVCRRCPVREPCLRWALEIGQTSGIWGGATEHERRAMARRTPARSSRQ
ncbi:WhiB family transcriptional regulator [Streptomyces sp. V3I7]|uniref:WhiB family transcriptional regulator n=1 Tax=Streptomyces sp. V3I7 TaxID=3042278 RepID=UPI00278A09E3|nr:WhiB family transcriptional regulator [Streptomyces sp. V3I7]MDQ0989007.1 WhiB family redox-sensing transcriptional regulator [Streptomyces sp. V3I7]